MKMNVFRSKWPAVLCCTALFMSACNQNASQTETAQTDQAEDHADHDMEAEGANKMMALMHENMRSMQEVKRKGDPDHDFALLMAVHHQGAIKMSEEQVESGSDTMLVNMARKDISKQKQEQERLQEFARNHKTTATDTSATSNLMQSMQGMMTNMNHDMQGTTDQQFATMMKMHHQSGIEMANAYISKAKVPEIKAMAQKIIDEQQADIQRLNKWLQEHSQ